MNNKIVLLDPSLMNNRGVCSDNLGDIIIFDAVFKILSGIFIDSELIRISTHSYMSDKEYKHIKSADYTFIGGSNLLSSHLLAYNQWKISRLPTYLLNSKLKNLILLGVGWWQYQSDPDLLTSRFYRNVLNSVYVHSVRDSYSKEMLMKTGRRNVVNTSCPTVWSLNGVNGNRSNTTTNKCLFTLTDYKPDYDSDSKLILTLFSFFKEIIYFPQGPGDIEYLKSLEVYRKNKSKFKLMRRSYNVFLDELRGDLCFVGTRLHGGIKCLENKMDSLIVAVDNRAIEIGKNISLPVVKRGDNKTLIKWLNGEKVFKNIHIPIDEINIWKNQFV